MVIDAIKTGISVRRGEKRDAVIVIPTTVVTKDQVKEFIDSNNTIY